MTDREERGNTFRGLKYHSWFLALLWTGCIAGSLLWNLHEQRDKIVKIACNSAQITFENDIIYRRWAAKQGGVYVRVSDHTPPNPYLKVPDRDVTTSSGLSLTLINPAYMARQVNQMAGDIHGSQGHITSLNPIRPENKPDTWEAAALKSFEQGIKEVSSVERIGNEEYMRLMRPFVTEKACLKCHASQGYKEGDIRGGISVSIPMAPLWAIGRPITMRMSLAHIALWIVGIAGIVISNKSLDKQILAREKAEAVLKQEKDFMKSLIETANDAIVSADHEGRVLLWNPAAEKIFGYTAAAVGGRELGELIVPEPSQNRFKEALGGFSKDFELELEKKDGVRFPAEISFSAAVGTGEKGRTWTFIVKDISARKQVEEELKKYRDELELSVEERTAMLSEAYEKLQAEVEERERVEDILRQTQKMEAVGTLAGGIAHDFNNILAGIIGFTEMAMDDIPPEHSAQRHLRLALKGGMRGRDVVRQILAFSRKTQYERRPVSLSPLIRETAKLLRASIPTTIEIVVHTTILSDTICANPVEIQQIVMNLCTNAAHAMQENGGKLSITLSEADTLPGLMVGPEFTPAGYVQITIKDTGAGMDPEVMKRIFEPFFTTKEVGHGTGMGLAVVYGIVKALKGAITVESEPAMGSTFRIFLPKMEAGAILDIPETEEIPRGNERILFVDDDEALAESAKIMLERLGYTTTVMMDSVQALNAFSQNPSRFDLVFTDHTMPKITGFNLAGELLKIRSDIPIILCTGHNDTISPEKVKAAGIKEFLMKPLTRREIAQAIRRVLDTKAE